MPTIPPEHLPLLAAVGIIDPEHSRWERGNPVTDGRIQSMEFICWCGNEPKRVAVVPLGDRPILIGECSKCRLVRWSEWLAPMREWTGGRNLESAKPMYEKGWGA